MKMGGIGSYDWAERFIPQRIKGLRKNNFTSGGVAKARNMLDIPALSRLARQAPQRLKSVN
jgi:hypothetical protein